MIRFSDKFDLVVVGGGPAGSVAAKTAASAGISTVLLEKDRDFGIPVRCAEGLDLQNLDLFIPLNPKWIDNKLEKIRFHSPSGIELDIKYDRKGAILNRKLFDFELALSAAKAGALVRNRCYVIGLSREDGQVQIKFESYGKEYYVKAPLVIGADGVESRVGRWTGFKTHLPLKDIETCFQYTICHPEVDAEYCDFFFGEKVAPGGYLWIFPKGEACANVGIGISADRARKSSPKDYLDDFMVKHFPGASHLSSVAGSVPASKPLKYMAVDNVMLAGDAAYQSDPLTGGGIMSGMWGGFYAGETAVEALNKGDFSAQMLSRYTKEWYRKFGNTHKVLYQMKKAVHNLDDDRLNHTAEILKNIPYEQCTLRKVFQTVLFNQPALLLEVFKIFIT
jgi:digeranylgeranylglycerophospholipid reductase